MTPQAAAKVLRDRSAEAKTIVPMASQSVSRLRDLYLQWVEITEGHLRWMTEDAEILDMLQTEAFWRIRDLVESSVRPFPLVGDEAETQSHALRRLAEGLEERVERVSAAPGHLAVVDTHVLLHYLPPDQLDWLSLLGQPLVRLVVPLRVIEELDEKKYTAREEIRDRARRLLPQLHAVLRPGGTPGQLREGVTLEVLLDSGCRVRPSDADSEVLDTCQELALISSQSVTLVTGDTGMTLRAEARGIHVLRPPDNWLRNPPTATRQGPSAR